MLKYYNSSADIYTHYVHLRFPILRLTGEIVKRNSQQINTNYKHAHGWYGNNPKYVTTSSL